MQHLHRALAHIEDNLAKDLTPAAVARAAGLSTFHFARLFRAVLGETVMGYVRRRRLCLAAKRLLMEEVPLIELSFDSRFESQEAFTRAFKRHFGMAPGRFRRERPIPPELLEAAIPADLLALNGEIKMEPKFVEKEAFFVAGLGDDFSTDTTSRIPDLWRDLGPRLGDIANAKPGVYYGLCLHEGKDMGQFRYVAGVEVPSLEGLPDGLEGHHVSSQRYAVFTHKIENPDLSRDLKRTLRHIFGTWLPKADVVYTGTADFELYDDRFDPNGPSGELDIYVPVTPR